MAKIPFVPGFVTLCLLLPFIGTGAAQPDLWTDVDRASLGRHEAAQRWVTPGACRTLSLDRQALLAVLSQAPMEGFGDTRASHLILALPMPDGAFSRFAVEESPVMEPELAAKFPEIKTYRGQGLDDATATVRMDWTPQGFHAMILSGMTDRIFIDPLFRGDTEHYASYFAGDYPHPDNPPFECHVESDSSGGGTVPAVSLPRAEAASGANLRTYRLAIAADVEYTAFFGGTVPLAMGGLTTTVNRVTGVYEVEVAIRMVMVANNNLIVYTAEPDPYTNCDTGVMLGENQANIDAVIGAANYDIGHVCGTGGGGRAGPGPCAASKARGVTCRNTPQGDPFDIDYVAHEIGHQFGGNHTFNGTTGSCGGGNRNAATAMEPGSGSTIMAYAGICGAEDLQPNSDPYFHGISFDEIVNYSTVGTGSLCGTSAATGNAPPTVNAGAGYTIPAQTPFTLTGSASDPNGDALTYCWEEFDVGTAAPPNTDDGSRTIFRSFNPATSPSRTFPRWSDILNNTATLGESLPTTTRTMQFRLTARDNRAGGGGVNNASTSVNVTSTAGPFQVTSPNTPVTWGAGTTQTVTWNVANTTAAPVSCANVNIRLSTNGGTSFPTTLVGGTPNDGSQAITVPGVSTNQARVLVEGAGNIFFDVSNTNFSICSITCTASGPTYALAGAGVSFASNYVPSNCSGAPSYAWTFGDGGTSTAQNPSHTYAVSGDYNWSVTVTVDGVSCTQSGTIHVCAVSCGATVPAFALAGTNVSFAGTESHSANCPGPATYAWAFGDGGTAATLNSTHSYAAAGTYNWTFTATVNGLTCTQTGTIAICTLSCSATVPAYAAAGAAVAFASTATLAGPCPGPITYAWTFGDGGTSTAQNPSHTYAAVGDYNWTLTVTANGLTCAQSGTIAVCTLTCTATVPATGVVAFPVSFASTATLTGSCPGPITYAWDFGDGATAATQNATHTYGAGGTFTWTLTVVANGITCSQTGTIKICPYDVSLADEYGRSRLCFNTVTGDWQWVVLRGPGIGTYTGTGTVTSANNVYYLSTPPGMPWTLSARYMQIYKRASASFSNRPLRFNSLLMDNNTTNNPICCP